MDKNEKHLIDMIQSYLKRENYSINKEDLTLQLLSNQSFPSVKSITDSLDYFGVKNIAVSIPKSALNQLPGNFIAVMKERGQGIVLVSQSAKGIKLFKTDGTREKLDPDAFCERWTGTIIAIEGETENVSKARLTIESALIPLGIITIGAILSNVLEFNLQGLIYAVLSTIGIGVSYYLVQEDLGVHNATTAKICNSANANISCEQVVKSNNSRLFKIFSLSDISITYFTSLLSIMALLGFNPYFFGLLSVLSIPVVLYSLYSQAFLLKKWCPLCLVVGAVLMSQFINSLAGTAPLLPELLFSVKALAVISVTYLFWLYLKSMIKDRQELRQTKTDFLKFKRTENLFGKMLAENPKGSSALLDDRLKITFGNPDARLTIYSVTNPLCGYCTDSFKVFDQLLKTHGSRFKLHVVFSVPTENSEQQSTQIAQRIVELYQQNRDAAYTALSNWYHEKNAEQWLSKHGLPNDESAFNLLIETKAWCRENDIKGTPTTLIGQYLFPHAYKPEDLFYLIDDLIEDNTTRLTSAEPVLV
ncbi:MAG: hypothetical protein Roseis2KO_33910 [Roseivirga sp.]